MGGAASTVPQRRQWPIIHSAPARGPRYYMKIAALYFALGSAVELLFIALGFYRHEFRNDADVEAALQKHAFRRTFYEELQKAAQERGAGSRFAPRSTDTASER